MRRISVSLAVLFCVPLASAAQAAAQTGSAPPPAVRARWPAPLKGDGTIEVIQGAPRRQGDQMVTLLKIKNTSDAPLALLTVDEFWYNDKGGPVSGDTYRHKQLIEPGAIVEVTTRSPWRVDMRANQFMFKHANGKIVPKAVKKFSQ